MCRSIKQLRLPDRPATDQETYEAARQYVRKVSGFYKPSQANQDAYEAAIDEIAAATKRLLGSLQVRGARTFKPV